MNRMNEEMANLLQTIDKMKQENKDVNSTNKELHDHLSNLEFCFGFFCFVCVCVCVCGFYLCVCVFVSFEGTVHKCSSMVVTISNHHTITLTYPKNMAITTTILYMLCINMILTNKTIEKR